MNDASDTCVASVLLLDGLAMVLLACKQGHVLVVMPSMKTKNTEVQKTQTAGPWARARKGTGVQRDISLARAARMHIEEERAICQRMEAGSLEHVTMRRDTNDSRLCSNCLSKVHIAAMCPK